MQRERKGNIRHFDGLNADKKKDVKMNIVTKELKGELYFLPGIARQMLLLIAAEPDFFATQQNKLCGSTN